jgi:integrase
MADKSNEIKDVQPIRNKDDIEKMKEVLKTRPWLNPLVDTSQYVVNRDYILFMVGINTGLRIGDLLKLKVKQVKGKSRFMVKEGKTQKPREIWINDNLREEINEYVKTLPKGTEWLFPSRQGDKPITPVQAWRILNKGAEYAGLESVGTHTLRKTFGYWHYKQFKDVAELQEILNHSHPQITLRYIGITKEQIQNNLKQFEL